MRWTILDISWLIFLLHTSPLCDNFLTVFTTSAAYYWRAAYEWRKTHTHTHTHTHRCRRRENEKRVVLQLERGRCVCHSLLCDATRTSEWTHTHTHDFHISYPILYAYYIARVHFKLQKSLAGAARDLNRGGKMEHASSNSFSLPDPHLPPCVRLTGTADLHGHLPVKWDAWEKWECCFGKWTPPEFPLWETPESLPKKKKKKKKKGQRASHAGFRRARTASQNCSGAHWLTLRSHLHTCTQDSKQTVKTKAQGAPHAHIPCRLGAKAVYR